MKKKLQKEVFREMKENRYFEKPSAKDQEKKRVRNESEKIYEKIRTRRLLTKQIICDITIL